MTGPSRTQSEPVSALSFDHSPTVDKPATSHTDCPVQCQGCGAVRGSAWLGKGHACWVNEDGTREEGGTFQ